MRESRLGEGLSYGQDVYPVGCRCFVDEVAEDRIRSRERCEVGFLVVTYHQAIRIANNQPSRLGPLVFKYGVVQLSKIRSAESGGIFTSHCG